MSACECTLISVSASRGHQVSSGTWFVLQSPALWRQGLSLKVVFPLSHLGQKLAGSSDLPISRKISILSRLLLLNCFCECWDSNSGPHSHRTSNCWAISPTPHCDSYLLKSMGRVLPIPQSHVDCVWLEWNHRIPFIFILAQVFRSFWFSSKKI